MGESKNPQWLRLPDHTQLLLVDTKETLEEAHNIVDKAYVCGIDAEWDPYMSKPYAASLLQIAVRCHGGGEYALLVVLPSFQIFKCWFCAFFCKN